MNWIYSESISEVYFDCHTAELVFEFVQGSVYLALRFAKATQMIIQSDVRLTTAANNCVTMANLPQEWSCPKIAAWAMDINALSVEIDCHA
jgi:hypothetical protein